MHKFFLSDSSYAVNVDYSMPLPEMIVRARLQSVGRDVTSSSSLSAQRGRGDLVVRLAMLRPGHDATTCEVLAWMKDSGLTPVGIAELLGFAAMVPRAGLTRRVHALASLAQDAAGNRSVMTCYLRGLDRRLQLCPIRWEPAWIAAFDCFPCVTSPS